LQHSFSLPLSAVAACCRSSLHDRFVSALQQQRPEVLEALAAKQAAAAQQREAEHRLCQLFKQPAQQQPGDASAAENVPDAAAAAAGGHVGHASGTDGFCFGFQVVAGGDGDSKQGGAAVAGGFSFGFDILAADAAGDEGERQQQNGSGSAAEGLAAEKEEEQQQQQQQRGKGKRGRQQKAAVAQADSHHAAAGEVAKKSKWTGGKRQH
jgi:hypothetical protein